MDHYQKRRSLGRLASLAEPHTSSRKWVARTRRCRCRLCSDGRRGERTSREPVRGMDGPATQSTLMAVGAQVARRRDKTLPRARNPPLREPDLWGTCSARRKLSADEDQSSREVQRAAHRECFGGRRPVCSVPQTPVISATGALHGAL